MFPKFILPTLEMQKADFVRLENELKQERHLNNSFRFTISTDRAIHFEVVKDEAKKENFSLVEENIHYNPRHPSIVKTYTSGEIILERKINFDTKSFYEIVLSLRELCSQYHCELVAIEVV